MSLQTIAEIVLALAAIGLIIARQVRWRRFDPARALRLPIVLGAIGLLNLVDTKQRTAHPATDLLLLVAEFALSVAVGAVMGRLTVFRAAPDGSGALQSRTGWVGASMWFVLIAVRIGLDALGAVLGSHLATTTGVILVMIAASRGASALVARGRAPQSVALSA